VLPLVEPALADIPFEPDASHTLQCSYIVGCRKRRFRPPLKPGAPEADEPATSPA
jgi:hypothetical protein